MTRIILLLIAAALFCEGCGPRRDDAAELSKRVLYMSGGGRVNTLDPAMADDLMSQYMTAAFYDTLLQYDYTVRPYKLLPSMLKEMPEVSQDMKEYRFRLRDDLYFQPDVCFGANAEKEKRKITSKDVVFSFLRLADARLHSPGFWLFRDKIKGMEKFRELSAKAGAGDYTIYDKAYEGFEITDDKSFVIRLSKPDPRFLYALVMPYASVVSRKAVEHYGGEFPWNPVGSGPFRLREWQRDYKIILDRNSEYREEFFPLAQNFSDRGRRLPLLDTIVCYLVRQPLSAWLIFLQGGMDMSSLDKDNFDAVVGEDLKLVPALAKRGIKLLQIPEFQVNYIGFCFADPLMAENINLRRAMACAYDLDARIKHFNHCIIPANGPIPPGVAGYDEKYENPYKYNLEKAREYMRLAGYPDGIDPATGKSLEIAFDQMGNSAQHRQLAELMAADMKKIGISIKPFLNNKPRFLQKAEKGQLQVFRLNWVGDYPDAENFLQLFYSPNAGGCNRVFYKDALFDGMYREVQGMPDCQERTEKYMAMSEYLTEQCPWIFESYPVSFQLIHCWLENYLPHDFAFSRWKYLSVDTAQREKCKASFKPLEMWELRK